MFLSKPTSFLYYFYRYYWEKNGQRLEINAINIRQVMAEGTIIIEQPDEDREGVYQCFAKNDYGIALSTRAVLRKACE